MPGFSESFGALSPTVHGLVVSSILLPAAFTSFFAGHLADKVGRLNAITIGAVIYAVGAAVEAGAVSLTMFIPGRALAGIGEGLFLSTVIVYICEICPPERRGPVASLVQLLTTFGIPAGYFICYGSVNIESSYSWRLPFILQAVLAIALACICRFLPSSPHWEIDRGHPSRAGPAIDRLQLDIQQFQEELESARRTAGDNREPEAQKSYQRLLWVLREDNRKQAFLGMFLMGAMQFSGIDAVLYVSPKCTVAGQVWHDRPIILTLCSTHPWCSVKPAFQAHKVPSLLLASPASSYSSPLCLLPSSPINGVAVPPLSGAQEQWPSACS